MTEVRHSDYAATLLRVSIGVMFVAHALLKIFVFTVPGTVGFFEKVGFPGVLAYPVIAFELIGGVLLIAGVFTRWIALAGVPVLLGALMVHSGNGWMFASPNGGWEFPAFWTVALVALALLGDGAYSARTILGAK
ncbi:MAG: DoxX family protein [Beijerinckiaceae bacterium]|nr:DoxX family protein [Beijerinckiaceae bacterium]